MTDQSRRCKNPSCNHTIPDYKRLDTEFCSPACSKRFRRMIAVPVPEEAAYKEEVERLTIEFEAKLRTDLYPLESRLENVEISIAGLNGRLERMGVGRREKLKQIEELKKKIKEADYWLNLPMEEKWNRWFNKQYREAKEKWDEYYSYPHPPADLPIPEDPNEHRSLVRVGYPEGYAAEKIDLQNNAIREDCLKKIDAIAIELEKVPQDPEAQKLHAQLKETEMERDKIIEEIAAVRNREFVPPPYIGPKREDRIVKHSATTGEETAYKPSGKGVQVRGSDISKMKFITFRLDGELGRFLGKLEPKKMAIALTGDSGAGKSIFSFMICRLLVDAGYRIIYYSLEMGITEEVQKQVIANGLDSDNFHIKETGTLDDVRHDAQYYDVIVVDSFGKLTDNAKEFENLRDAFPRTIFLMIFQKTTAGTVRGGASIVYNSTTTIDLKVKKDAEGNVIDRYATMVKGRNGTIGWKYSVMQGKVTFMT